MIAAMDGEGFGGCTTFGECQRACPKDIALDHIAAMNREGLLAVIRSPLKPRGDRAEEAV